MHKSAIIINIFRKRINLFCLGVCVVLGAFVLNLAVEPALIAHAATCAGTTITGTAFRDYNANGVKDPSDRVWLALLSQRIPLVAICPVRNRGWRRLQHRPHRRVSCPAGIYTAGRWASQCAPPHGQRR